MNRLLDLVAEMDRANATAVAVRWSDPRRADLLRSEAECLRIVAYHRARYLGRDDYADTLVPVSRPSQTVATDGDSAPSCAPVAGPPLSGVAL